MSSPGSEDNDAGDGAPVPAPLTSPWAQPEHDPEPSRTVVSVIGQIIPARSLLPHLMAAAVLALMLSLFFWRLTVEHKVLSPADLIYGSYPWVADPPPEYGGPSNAYQSDDAFLYFPRRWAHYHASDGWWQDDYLAGSRASFSNDFIGLDFYPVSWVYRILPFPVANSFFHAGVLLVAGLSMYLLLWQLKLPWVARVYGGMLFMLNGHFIVWVGAWQLPAMLGIVPLMIFGFERHRERRQLPYLAIPAACFAIQLYLAYIPAWVVTGAILAIYGAARMAPGVARRQVRATASMAAAFAGAVITGLLLGLYSALPSVASALGSSYQADRALGLHHLPLEDAWTYLFPNYWGTHGAWTGFAGNYPEWVAYAGVTAIPLSFLGAWHLRRQWLGWFSLIVLIFSASQVFGIPPLKEVASLPGIKQVGVGRWFFGLNLAAALLAPAGLACLMKHQFSVRERRFITAAGGVLLVIAVGAVLALYFERRDSPRWEVMVENRHLIPTPADVAEGLDDFLTHFHRQAVLLLSGFGLAAGALWLRNRARLVAVGFLTLGFLDLFGFGQDYPATVRRGDLYPETPGIEFLQQKTGLNRIAPIASDGGRQVLPGYTANLYGLSIVTGYDHYRDEDYLRFLDPLRSDNDRDISRLYGYVTVGTNREPLEPALLRLLNIRYVVTSPSGLFSLLGGQLKNETAFPIYGDRTQGQILNLAGNRTDAVELLMATGGLPPPDDPVIVHVKRSPDADEDITTVSIPGSAIADNSWRVIELGPARHEPGVYIEVEAPGATEGSPLYLWGVGASPGSESQRFDSGNPVPGSVTFRLLRSTEDWATPVYGGDDLIVYEVKDSLPRAWGAGRVIEVSDKQAAMEAVAADSFDPATSVVLTAEELSGLATSPSAGDFRSEIEEYSSDSMTVSTDYSAPGLLVVSTRYDVGWQAKVDGQDADLLRADGILMAVPVEAGQHTVELQFEPPEYVWGRRVTIASVILTLGAASLVVGYRRYKSRLRTRSR